MALLDITYDIVYRSYGNLSRFIRRSCCPNAEVSLPPRLAPPTPNHAPPPSQVRHFFVSSELHFGVYALNNIAPDEEVTLTFDFRYDKW